MGTPGLRRWPSLHVHSEPRASGGRGRELRGPGLSRSFFGTASAVSGTAIMIGANGYASVLVRPERAPYREPLLRPFGPNNTPVPAFTRVSQRWSES